MTNKDEDSQYLYNRLDAYMVFIEEELKTVAKHPIIKRKKFLESFMVFYEGYLDVRGRVGDADDVFPKALHEKIMKNLEKIRRLAYIQDDYLFEMRTNLDYFEDSLMEIFYLAYNETKSKLGSELDEKAKKSLTKKSKAFLSDLAKTIAQYRKDFKEDVPKDIPQKAESIKTCLKRDFGIIIDEYENLGPVVIICVDSDAILDMYEKIKKMRKGKPRDAEQAKLDRMYEIYNK